MKSAFVDPADFGDACRFVEKLVEAAQSYGVSSRAMLLSLARIVDALGLRREFLATPNYVQTIPWSGEEPRQRVHLAVLRSGRYHLCKLARVMALADDVAAGIVRPREGLEKLEAIIAARDMTPPGLTAFCFALCAVAFATILGASWMDAWLGGVLALVSFGVTVLASRSPGVAALQELIAAICVSFLAFTVAAVVPGTQPLAMTVLALIVFVPGFGLTVAPSELVVGNTLSGLVWLTNALVAKFQLLGGVAIGSALAVEVGLPVAEGASAERIAAGWQWLAVPVLVSALAILMRVSWRSRWAIVVGGFVAWGAVLVLRPAATCLGTFGGALALILFARWYGGRFRVPSVVVVLPCVMILVSGVAALRALQTASVHGFAMGVSSAAEVLVIIMALVCGALAGDIIVPPKAPKPDPTRSPSEQEGVHVASTGAKRGG